jgi:hypothetical protein
MKKKKSLIYFINTLHQARENLFAKPTLSKLTIRENR